MGDAAVHASPPTPARSTEDTRANSIAGSDSSTEDSPAWEPRRSTRIATRAARARTPDVSPLGGPTAIESVAVEAPHGLALPACHGNALPCDGGPSAARIARRGAR